MWCQTRLMVSCNKLPELGKWQWQEEGLYAGFW